MKSRKLLLLFILLTLNSYSQIVDIPDNTFKLELLWIDDLNTTLDAEIDSAEAADYVGPIILFKKGIKDITGIEAFTSLTFLDVSGNDLTDVDISGCTSLEEIWIYNNFLSSLDVSNNLQLTRIRLDNNSLTSLDVSNNTLLQILSVAGNDILYLDMSSNDNLQSFSCYNNDMLYLNIKNGVNSSAVSFGAELNPSLCIDVDDADWSNTNWSSFKDSTASFSNDCATLGIEDHKTSSNIIGIFDLYGRRVYQMKSGNTYIVKYDNGVTVKKHVN